jgi:hypothetical protein
MGVDEPGREYAVKMCLGKCQAVCLRGLDHIGAPPKIQNQSVMHEHRPVNNRR